MLNFSNTAKRDAADVLLSCSFPCKICLIQETVTSVLFLDSVFTKMLQRFPRNECLRVLFEYMSVPPGKLPEEKWNYG